MTADARQDHDLISASASRQAVYRLVDLARRVLEASDSRVTAVDTGRDGPSTDWIDRTVDGGRGRLAAWIRLDDGRIAGTLEVFGGAERVWTTRDTSILGDLAACVAREWDLSALVVPRQQADVHGDTDAARLDETDDLRTPPRSMVGVATGGGARILLADDLDLNRKLICDMLAIDGHSVDGVADGAAAVKAAAECDYDLILMDMIMPGMDGLAATKAIRALPEPSCNVPIVALTAHSFNEQLDSCLAAGMDATLTKPMSLDALTSAVALWTRGRRRAA